MTTDTSHVEALAFRWWTYNFSCWITPGGTKQLQWSMAVIWLLWVSVWLRSKQSNFEVFKYVHQTPNSCGTEWRNRRHTSWVYAGCVQPHITRWPCLSPRWPLQSTQWPLQMDLPLSTLGQLEMCGDWNFRGGFFWFQMVCHWILCLPLL